MAKTNIAEGVAPTPPASADQVAFDKFYPESTSVRNAARGQGMAQIGWVTKLRGHLAAAVLGDRERESRLVNRIGQIRRMVPTMSACSPETKQVLRESVAWLKAVGREVDMMNEEPARWISQRGGHPRW